YQRAVRAPNIGELYSAAAGAQVQFSTPPNAGDPCYSRFTRSSQLQALCVSTGVPSNIVSTYIFPTTATAGITSGNPALTPEKAAAYNVCAVWNSTFSSP